MTAFAPRVPTLDEPGRETASIPAPAAVAPSAATESESSVQPEIAPVSSAPGLPARVDALTPKASAADALEALLRSWGYDKPIGGELDPDLFPEAVRAIAPLSVLATRANPQMLASLDLPAVLELEPRAGERRYVALLGLTEDGGALVGMAGDEVDLDRGALERIWTGRTFYLWTNFESLPVLTPGMKGGAVRWLQARLAELGYLKAGAPTEQFDELHHRRGALVPASQRDRADGRGRARDADRDLSGARLHHAAALRVGRGAVSTILDALRKVQRDRAAENPSRDLRGSITTETPSVVPEKRRGRSVWIALLLLLVAVGSGGYWLYRSGAIGQLPSVASDDEGAASEAELEAAAREAAAVPEAPEPAPPVPSSRAGQSGRVAACGRRAAAAAAGHTRDRGRARTTRSGARERARRTGRASRGRGRSGAPGRGGGAGRGCSAASLRRRRVRRRSAPAVVAKAAPETPKATPKPAPEAGRAQARRREARGREAGRARAASVARGARRSRSSAFPAVRVESIRWHPIPERRVASLHFEQQDAPEAREGDIVAGVLIYRIDPGAVELRIGSAQRVVSPEP